MSKSKKQTTGGLIAVFVAVAVAILAGRGNEDVSTATPQVPVAGAHAPSAVERAGETTASEERPTEASPTSEARPTASAPGTKASSELGAPGTRAGGPVGEVAPAPQPRGGLPGKAPAPTGVDPESGLPWIAREALPIEAHQTLAAISTDGPYDFERDRITFQNREGILPKRARGHYREFTVKTPQVRSRGARRIVTGRSGEQYYTGDHYASFGRIAP